MGIGQYVVDDDACASPRMVFGRPFEVGGKHVYMDSVRPPESRRKFDRIVRIYDVDAPQGENGTPKSPTLAFGFGRDGRLVQAAILVPGKEAVITAGSMNYLHSLGELRKEYGSLLRILADAEEVPQEERSMIRRVLEESISEVK